MVHAGRVRYPELHRARQTARIRQQNSLRNPIEEKSTTFDSEQVGNELLASENGALCMHENP
jgi:hypothetical protein